MKKLKISTLTSALVLVLALGTTGCSNGANAIHVSTSVFNAFDTIYEKGGAYETWDSVYLDYTYFGYCYEQYTSIGSYSEETTTRQVYANVVDDLLVGYDQTETTHFDTYINGGLTGKYYDGSTLYQQNPVLLDLTGAYTVTYGELELDLDYFSEYPFSLVDHITSVINRLDKNYLSYQNFGFTYKGETQTSKNGTSVVINIAFNGDENHSKYGYGNVNGEVNIEMHYDSEDVLELASYSYLINQDFEHRNGYEGMSFTVSPYNGEVPYPSWLVF